MKFTAITFAYLLFTALSLKTYAQCTGYTKEAISAYQQSQPLKMGYLKIDNSGGRSVVIKFYHPNTASEFTTYYIASNSTIQLQYDNKYLSIGNDWGIKVVDGSNESCIHFVGRVATHSNGVFIIDPAKIPLTKPAYTLIPGKPTFEETRNYIIGEWKSCFASIKNEKEVHVLSDCSISIETNGKVTIRYNLKWKDIYSYNNYPPETIEWKTTVSFYISDIEEITPFMRNGNVERSMGGFYFKSAKNLIRVNEERRNYEQGKYTAWTSSSSSEKAQGVCLYQVTADYGDHARDSQLFKALNHLRKLFGAKDPIEF